MNRVTGGGVGLVSGTSSLNGGGAIDEHLRICTIPRNQNHQVVASRSTNLSDMMRN
jgi:hypothetical protein